MPTTMTAKAQVTIPKAVRDKAGIQPGDKLEVELSNDGRVSIRKVDMLAGNDNLEIALARIRTRRLARQQTDPVLENMTTDEFMRFMRGDD